MRYIVREIRHFMKQSSFWLSVGIVLFCFFFEHRDYFSFYAAGELLYALDVFYLFVTPFEYGLFFYLVPLAAIPPAALSVIDELKSGHARLKLYRSSQKAYIAKRLVSISIGSMLPMLIGCLLFFAFSMFVGPLSGENGVSMRQASTTVLQPLATVQFGLPYIFFVMGQATLSAWLWGMIGALLALASLNKGTTLMNGFLLFWGCDCLCNYLHLSAWRPFTLFFTPLSSMAPLWESWLKNILLLGIVTCMDAAWMNHRYRRL